MGRHRTRPRDADRTALLDQPELWVQKGKGGQNYFRAWLVEQDIESCPLCDGKVIKVQDLFSKTYTDLISDGGQKHVISLEYRFYKWRCLNDKCRHIFAKDIGFAIKTTGTLWVPVIFMDNGIRKGGLGAAKAKSVRWTLF